MRRGRTEISDAKESRRLFFSLLSREKSCQVRPKATIERKKKKKNGAARKPPRERPSRPAIEITPREKRARTKPRRSNSRSAFHFFSKIDREVAADERKDYFHSQFL